MKSFTTVLGEAMVLALALGRVEIVRLFFSATFATVLIASVNWLLRQPVTGSLSFRVRGAEGLIFPHDCRLAETGLVLHVLETWRLDAVRGWLEWRLCLTPKTNPCI